VSNERPLIDLNQTLAPKASSFFWAIYHSKAIQREVSKINSQFQSRGCLQATVHTFEEVFFCAF
jgi:hypothetical protein